MFKSHINAFENTRDEVDGIQISPCLDWSWVGDLGVRSDHTYSYMPVYPLLGM